MNFSFLNFLDNCMSLCHLNPNIYCVGTMVDYRGIRTTVYS